MVHKLYGDGIHDDTPAIQEMLDTCCEVRLGAPKVRYLISKPLVLHSGNSLVLPRFAEIRLMAGANCLMLKNETVDDYGERSESGLLKTYLNYYSPDVPCKNIYVEGGIWNFNNKLQNPNPLSNGLFEPEQYGGFAFLFYNVSNLNIRSLTIKDPANFGCVLDTVSYFHIDNITFDYNDGNLYQSNMDGFHCCGNCHHGTIENLYGTCYDDIVALNAQEGSCGHITDITVRGIYTEGSYGAVRLLCSCPKSDMKNIHISDIYGTFYHFGVSFQHYYDTGERGTFENIVIENIYASKSDRDVIKFYLVHKYPKYGIVDIGQNNIVKNLTIRNVHRKEYIDTTPTILVRENSDITNLTLDNITAENCTDDAEMKLCEFNSKVKYLHTNSLYQDGIAVKIK